MTSGGHTMTEGWNLQLQGRVRDLEADLAEAARLLDCVTREPVDSNQIVNARLFLEARRAKRARAAAQAKDIAAFMEQEGASEALPEARSADTPTSPNAREAALRIMEAYESDEVSGPQFHKFMEICVTTDMVVSIARALLPHPHDGERAKALQIAAIVETYTDILSPETARKVASRIRALLPSGDGK